ncbi:MAG: hypothetical protein A3H94_01530 [Acidobacteria bacterium RIFCSPLOWO2_02_FULL_60_20]|nr:MAG: hypothetical protein A3H94_01530 [Acidobacteria bacterium RIFCSPLOWO2_02_FULL_60_20]
MKHGAFFVVMLAGSALPSAMPTEKWLLELSDANSDLRLERDSIGVDAGLVQLEQKNDPFGSLFSWRVSLLNKL